jgi:hypothetical protein
MVNIILNFSKIFLNILKDWKSNRLSDDDFFQKRPIERRWREIRARDRIRFCKLTICAFGGRTARDKQRA